MGFERKDLKTLSFNIDTQYERYNFKRLLSMFSTQELIKKFG